VFSATVLDLRSRRMVGFATSNDYPTAEPAKAATNTAVATRGGNIKGVILHPDKGSQYTAGACRRLGTHRSPGRTGNALDNDPAESLSSTLQHEPIDQRAWAAKTQARQEISLWAQTWYTNLVQPPPAPLRHRNDPTRRTRTHPHPSSL